MGHEDGAGVDGIQRRIQQPEVDVALEVCLQQRRDLAREAQRVLACSIAVGLCVEQREVVVSARRDGRAHRLDGGARIGGIGRRRRRGRRRTGAELWWSDFVAQSSVGAIICRDLG